ncbi:MAG: hypothetical protein EAZ61_08850 [Oscillatoriales cyanobacterium]|jgi:uncharacterized membrane protein|nr:MAG: hypothetical protein EAZ61_08850 [Oscillatoriales cyanobacterium]
MQIQKPNRDPLSESDRQALQQLRQQIEQTIARGSISRKEHTAILAQMYADGIVTDRECELFRLMQEKIWCGDLHIEA